MSNPSVKKKGVFLRLIKLLFKSYPVLVPVAMFCIMFAAAVSAIPAVFMQQVFLAMEKWAVSGDWAQASAEIIPKILILAGLYVISSVLITVDSQLMAYITQGFLCKMRRKMFDGMQNLPIKYFDTHKHGDIMSYYTNDLDTLRELISRSLPTLLRSGIVVLTVFFIMIYYSVWLTLVLILGVFLMLFVSKKAGKGSAKHFRGLQKSVAGLEGYIQEMMNGQKVVKVFSREEKCKEEFAKVNEKLYQEAYRAHAYSNALGPIIMNIGNVMYVIMALCAIKT